jgi:predicted dehydrogenase
MKKLLEPPADRGNAARAMTPITRRAFLRASALAAGAALAPRLPTRAWAEPAGAGDAVRFGIIGLRNRGGDHLKRLRGLPGVRVVALCDLDPQVLARVAGGPGGEGTAPFTTTEARELIARPDVDAVVIATPDHWHALLTVWACQAGKDVYVEKPMSHSVWEGRRMVEAARRHGRIVQVGTQHRSDPGLLAARSYLREGHLGKILHVHAVYCFRRKDIGYRLPWYPDWLDYDRYCGPAPMAPLERANLHYDWHWTWATGTGDLGNNGVHVLDAGLFFSGHEALPPRILALGGRYVVGDRAETPNSMLAVYDYPQVPFVFEHRGLPARSGSDEADKVLGVAAGVVVHCEGGYFAGLKGGKAYDSEGRVVMEFTGDDGAGHMPNFLDAVRSRRAVDLVAPVEVGHVGASLCHCGNISYRIGESAGIDQVRASVGAVPAAGPHLEELLGNLRANGVDLGRLPLRLGPWINVEGDAITGVESGGDAGLERARFLLRGAHRPPYLLPEGA